jgi:hypothetical protein
MWSLGFALAVIGGGWIGVWAIERTFTRHGIHQAFGDTTTREARAEADARGKAHQQRMLRVARLGLAPAALLLGVGVVILIVAPR